MSAVRFSDLRLAYLTEEFVSTEAAEPTDK